MKEIGTVNVKLKSEIKDKKVDYEFINFPLNKYKMNEKIATRDAFGKALVSLGRKNKNVVVLDGDVKNSTRTGEFFRFIIFV